MAEKVHSFVYVPETLEDWEFLTPTEEGSTSAEEAGPFWYFFVSALKSPSSPLKITITVNVEFLPSPEAKKLVVREYPTTCWDTKNFLAGLFAHYPALRVADHATRLNAKNILC